MVFDKFDSGMIQRAINELKLKDEDYSWKFDKAKFILSVWCKNKLKMRRKILQILNDLIAIDKI